MKDQKIQKTDTPVAKTDKKSSRLSRMPNARKSLIFSLLSLFCSCFCFVPFGFIAFFVGDLIFVRLALVYKERFYDAGGKKSSQITASNIICIISTVIAILTTVYAVLITYAMIF